MGKRKIIIEEKYTDYRIEGSANGSDRILLKVVKDQDRPHNIYYFDSTRVRYVRVADIKGALNNQVSFSGLRVFGKGNGHLSSKVSNIKAEIKGLDAYVSWISKTNAEGYNVRYCTSKNKLYNSWQVFGENQVKLSIDKDRFYYVAIDSFNENGVTLGEVLPLTTDVGR